MIVFNDPKEGPDVARPRGEQINTQERSLPKSRRGGRQVARGEVRLDGAPHGLRLIIELPRLL